MSIYRLRPAVRWVRARLRPPPAAPSRVRRIERVWPPAERLVAITFDDGPTRGLTEEVLAALARHGARGTFDVIGSTADNYPDAAGPAGGPLWSGRAFDHYAAFERDGEAGLAAQADLARRIADGGHELANHSYRHLAFGFERLVYRGRRAWDGASGALADLRRLHGAAKEITGQDMRLGRPPHYVDRTRDGWDAYDLYDALGYDYLAASFDLGGWQASRGTRQQTVEAAVAPLRAALEADPGGLSGQVLFAKDGYNMSLEPVVCWALPLQLDLLAAHGYRVITVSELVRRSPFADVPPDDPVAAHALRLLAARVPCAFRDNTLRPETPLLRREFAAWLAGPVSAPALVTSRQDPATVAAERGWLAPGPGDRPVDAAEVERALGRWEWTAGSQDGAAVDPPAERPSSGPVSHRAAIGLLVAALGARAAPAWTPPAT